RTKRMDYRAPCRQQRRPGQQVAPDAALLRRVLFERIGAAQPDLSHWCHPCHGRLLEASPRKSFCALLVLHGMAGVSWASALFAPFAGPAELDRARGAPHVLPDGDSLGSALAGRLEGR